MNNKYMLRTTIDSLIESPNLAAPIEYNERSKQSFFNSIQRWGEGFDNKLSVALLNPFKAILFAAKDFYKNITNFNDGLPYLKKSYCILASLINIPQIPFLGLWAYVPEERKIIRGYNIQRYLACQGDLLVHEHLHAYQHLLHDSLLSQELITPRKIPSSIVEPPIFGFWLFPPSHKWLKRFEEKILRRLKKNQRCYN